MHPGHTLAEVIVNTGFEFDRPPDVPVTPAPSAETLRLMREVVAPELAEVYPQFAAKVFGFGKSRLKDHLQAARGHGFLRARAHSKHQENPGKSRENTSKRQ